MCFSALENNYFSSFKMKPPPSRGERSLVEFVLEPLYKIYSQVIEEHNKKSVETTLAELGVTLSNSAYRLNVRPLLRLACSSVFGPANLIWVSPICLFSTYLLQGMLQLRKLII